MLLAGLANFAVVPYALFAVAACTVFTATVARANWHSSRWWGWTRQLFGPLALPALPAEAAESHTRVTSKGALVGLGFPSESSPPACVGERRVRSLGLVHVLIGHRAAVGSGDVLERLQLGGHGQVHVLPVTGVEDRRRARL